MMTSIDAMRTMARTFDDAGNALRVASDDRREVSFLAQRLDVEEHRGQGKDFDLVRRLDDEVNDAGDAVATSVLAAIKGAKSALAAFDEQRIPVHMQTRIEVGGARQALEGVSIWGADLDAIGNQFLVAARAIDNDIATRLAQG